MNETIPSPESFFLPVPEVRLHYVGIGGVERGKERTLLLFVPDPFFETFQTTNDRSSIPFVPFPIAPFLEGIYNRRLEIKAQQGDDPDGDILSGYIRETGTHIDSVHLRWTSQGIYGYMLIHTSSGDMIGKGIDFRYTIIESALADIPIYIEESLLKHILSHVEVHANFSDGELSEGFSDSNEVYDTYPSVVDTNEIAEPQDVEPLMTYLRRQIKLGTEPEQEDFDLRHQIIELSEDELMALIDLSLEVTAYSWTKFLDRVLALKKGRKH